VSGPAEVTTESGVSIPESELDISAIRAQGPGGQHVNKSSTAIQLRFDVRLSAALSEGQKEKLMAVADRRVSADGVLTIKAQRYRSQEKNRRDAIDRLVRFIDIALRPVKVRKKTRPGRATREKRLQDKARRGRLKSLRKTLDD